MNYGIVKPVLIAVFISVLLSPMMIRYLHKLKFGQFIRGEGPESHLKISGTPTMGGLIILLGIVIASLFYVRRYPMIIPVLFVTLGFGFIGFIDDYIKVVMKRNLGLRAWQKMFGQIIVTGIFAYYLINYTQIGTSMLIPFTHGKYLNLGVFFIPAVFIILLGTVNGANFTDGLDGLASSVTVLSATFFTVAAIGMGHNDLAAGIWPATGRPSTMVMRFASAFWAVSLSTFSTPHSRSRLPNISGKANSRMPFVMGPLVRLRCMVLRSSFLLIV